MFFWPFDPTMVLILPALVFALWAQAKVRGTFERYLQVRSLAGLTGAQVARRLLDENGLSDVPIELIPGHLSDHYDPRTRTMRLSPDVYNSTSVAAISVAAHETGHAVQHARGYTPLAIRNNLFPVANFGSQLALPLFFIGLLLSWGPLMSIGILFFLGALAFQVVTLPVEFNASGRALRMLTEGGYLEQEEVGKARSVLTAAALTYVAGVAVALSHLIRLLVLRNLYSEE